MDTNSNELFQNRPCNECNSSDSVEIITIGGNGIALCMECRNKLRKILGIEQNPIGIELRNIDLTGITLVDELEKRDEEYKEFADALLNYLYDTNGITKEHLKEEACDVIQVVLSVLKILDIEVEEITEYWNSKHLEKIKNRPRNKEEQPIIKKSNLDKRICDCEDRKTNKQTYRDYIRESEEEFCIASAPIDRMDDEEFQQYLKFIDELWSK